MVFALLSLTACAVYPPASGLAEIVAIKADGTSAAVRGPIRSTGMVGCDGPETFEFTIGSGDARAWIVAGRGTGLQAYIYPPFLGVARVQSFWDPDARFDVKATGGPSKPVHAAASRGVDRGAYPEPPEGSDVVEIDMRVMLVGEPVAGRGSYLGGYTRCPRS